jgi:hypothetical protein
MLPFPHVMHFLANKFSGLGTGRLSLPSIFMGTFERFFFWHDDLLIVSLEGRVAQNVSKGSCNRVARAL